MQPTAEEQIRFLQNIQRLLTEGTFTATYKFTLLLALADLCVEVGDDSGSELRLETEAIAEKFIQYYWRQAVPFPGSGVTAVLKQNTGRQAAIIRKILRLRSQEGLAITHIRAKYRVWHDLVRDVDQTVRVMPLWKLQTIGSSSVDFLYENRGRGREIFLRAGIAYCLRQFHGLVTDLVRGAWVSYIRKHNQGLLGSTAELSEFLFGSNRNQLSLLRTALTELQRAACFYCRGRLQISSADVDHFIPWSRYPIDLGHNFVLAHRSCNSAKGDRLASQRHLENWVRRNRDFGPPLKELFSRKSLPFDLATSLRVAEWAYAQTEAMNGLTWERDKLLQPLGAGWRSLFALV